MYPFSQTSSERSLEDLEAITREAEDAEIGAQTVTPEDL